MSSDLSSPSDCPATQRAKLRPCYGRVKTGCLTCRRRKKKCDEVKPRCAGCRRNQIPCDWPPETKPGPNMNSPDQSIVVGNKQSPTAPLVCLSGKGRACDLTSVSQIFLRHYIMETGALLLPKPINRNPFITHVLPLACFDDTLMHGVLALSGTHLAYKQNTPEIESAALIHYLASVQALREELAHLRLDDGTATPRILLILIMLCHYELLSGDLTGKLYPHLQACRTLVQRVLSNEMSPQIVEQSADGDVVGFCLELYVWLILANSVTPFGTLVGEELPYDYFVYSMGSLSGYSTFGAMFGQLYELFEMIPKIAILASTRLAEEDLGLLEASDASLMTFCELEQQISDWTVTPTQEFGDADVHQQTVASDCMKHALHIYLITSILGSRLPDTETMDIINHHIAGVSKTTAELEPSPHICYLLWAMLISGSCMTKKEQQVPFLQRMETSRYQMKHLHMICKLLQVLWDDPDPSAFGPLGLHRLKQQGLWVPVC